MFRELASNCCTRSPMVYISGADLPSRIKNNVIAWRRFIWKFSDHAKGSLSQSSSRISHSLKTQYVFSCNHVAKISDKRKFTGSTGDREHYVLPLNRNESTNVTYPISLIIQNDQIPVTNVEPTQMITGIFSFKYVFINHKSSAFRFRCVSDTDLSDCTVLSKYVIHFLSRYVVREIFNQQNTIDLWR